MASWIKNLPAVQETKETWVPSLSWEDPLEKGVATHSNILAWKIPWTESGRLQSMQSQRANRTEPCHSTAVPRVILLSLFFSLCNPWTAARQASLSFTITVSLLTLMCIESVMPFSYLILCRPFLLLPSVFPSIRVFAKESALCTRWPKVLELQHQSFQWILRVDFL